MIRTISTSIATIEKGAATFLAGMITVLILLNVITRSIGQALFWVDETAIYTMIWMTMIGASLAIYEKNNISVTLIQEVLPQHYIKPINALIDLLIFFISLLLCYFCWIWFDPITLYQLGFDMEEFRAETFNFIYDEMTTTMGIHKYWIWMIMPINALFMLIHSIHNLTSYWNNPNSEKAQHQQEAQYHKEGSQS